MEYRVLLLFHIAGTCWADPSPRQVVALVDAVRVVSLCAPDWDSLLDERLDLILACSCHI